MMKRIGLTGSIGMGKSATAALFEEAGIPVFDSDACVHSLYAKHGEAVAAVEASFPGVTIDGAVDRELLGQKLRADPTGFERLEAIVHPLVLAARNAFVQRAEAAGAALVVFDIPLLFETGGDGEVDIIVVVSAPGDVRRQRVLERDGMTEVKLDAIIARQMPDSEKRLRADHIVETSGGIDDARRQVLELVKTWGVAGD
jgi:dephospho-CoA kinase